MRRIAVFTGSRAESDLLRPLMRRLDAFPDVDLTVVAGGAHLLRGGGEALDAIRADGLSVLEAPSFDEDGALPLHDVMAASLRAHGAALARLGPDLAVVLGDRYEMFCFAVAATTLLIPLAHIHGGELTGGALDDSFRHAVTKMSLLHFASCEEHRRRIIRLGEHPDRVWNVGAPGVENVLTLPLPSEEDIRRDLGIRPGHPFLVCAVHPVTLEPGAGMIAARNLLAVLDGLPDHDVVLTAANEDPEGREITALLRDAARRHPERMHFSVTLGAARHLGAARCAAAFAGNSSSGIIEIPSLGTPVVDIGSRQEGRMRSEAVIRCGISEDAIREALLGALSPEARRRAEQCPNPYDGRGTSERIAGILRDHPLDGGVRKTFFDVPFSGWDGGGS